jgi:hypothetical protein
MRTEELYEHIRLGVVAEQGHCTDSKYPRSLVRNGGEYRFRLITLRDVGGDASQRSLPFSQVPQRVSRLYVRYCGSHELRKLGEADSRYRSEWHRRARCTR